MFYPPDFFCCKTPCLSFFGIQFTSDFFHHAVPLYGNSGNFPSLSWGKDANSVVTYKSSVRITELPVISIFHQLRWLQKHVLITLPETNSSPLQMDGWNTTFLLGFGLFSGDMLVSGSVFQVYSWIMIQFDSRNLVAHYCILWSICNMHIFC